MREESAPWPEWREFVEDKSTLQEYEGDPEFLAIKKQIDEEYGEEKLRRSWLKTCAELEELTEEIKEKGSQIIPIIDMADVRRGCVAIKDVAEIRRVGCFVVRNVIEQCEMDRLYRDLKNYLSINKGRYTAWPQDSPSIFNLYNTPTQNALRIHPNQLQLMRWINGLWNYPNDDEEASPQPLLYADAVRVRPAKQTFLGLGPHIDAGSLCRWGDPAYRKVYHEIFAGNSENHDIFDMGKRKDANQALYLGGAHSTVMRAFQGWTAISKTAPREGTILLYPNVKAAISYVMLRPFFKPPSDKSKISDASQWTYDPSSSWFPGTFKPQSQLLSPTSHPHLRLKECLIHVPPIEPGDTVWWHTDMCHAVDAEHVGNMDASVAYIAATPNTPINKAYMQHQYDRMVVGHPPQDFVSNGVDESGFEEFQGFEGNPDIFKSLMGY
ncbi:hypothetical protein BGW36DRAFT_308058 [Talaromyces proteolyticus]|uniref:DUF1479 domain protein n=1 Tax=Talaromyces proteolyticus TaxID=1131652 RepID=A0AAD4KHA6_9EURO|nr:uncharacterized protein BGW36DRAFT_308058 [Talaromyces proteolyticus]KAH8689439.1 hypothetical protein BGW36DRAFT_308058 [Talaromyces proteolyticus]